MDTQSAADVPQIKLAKVGQGRKRRGAGAPWLGAKGAGSGFGGAMGGAGAAGKAGMTLGKAITVLLVTGSLSAGAWQIGQRMSGGTLSSKPAAKKLFVDKNAEYADTSDVIKSERTMPNSIGYVSGSLDGLTPEERARKAAEAEAARKAAEEEAARQETAQAEPATPSSASGMDALAGAAAAGKGGLGGGKFGKLSSAFSGGGSALSGGSGLSGGINRNFGSADALGGAAKAGALASMRAPSRNSVAAARGGRGSARTRSAMNQLKQTAKSTQGAHKMTAEGAGSTASAPFDSGANVGGDAGAITGGGVAQGGAGTVTDPNGGGGPIGDTNDVTPTVATPTMVNAAPYQDLINMAKVLMAIVSIVALISMFADSIPYIGQMIKGALAGILLVLGGMILAIGAAIYAQSGDIMISGIVGAVGALTIASSFFTESLVGGSETISWAAAGSLISNALGMFATSAVKPASMD